MRFAFPCLIGLALLTVSLAASAENAPGCPPTAQPLSAEQTQAGLKSARDRGFLWRMRKDGRTSYLYGTVHVAKLEWIFPGTTVVEAVRSSDIVALELDVLDRDITARLLAAMAPSPDQVLSDDLKRRLHAQVKAACLSERLLSLMSPEMVAISLMVMSARHDGLDPAYSIDSVVAGLARGLNKALSSLETPEGQVRLLRGQTLQESQVLAAQRLEVLETGKSRPIIVRIAQVWADGRFNELDRYEQWCDCVGTAEERALYKRLLDDRNPALADGIDALHGAGKRVFAALGSLHMIGKLGLPALMQQRGYQVERIEFKP